MGCLIASFTLVVELVASKHRRLSSMGLFFTISLGEFTVGLFALFLRNWRSFHWITSIPLFIMSFMCLLLSESPRWLYTKRKHKQLYIVFQSMAKRNGTKLPDYLETFFQELPTYSENLSKNSFANIIHCVYMRNVDIITKKSHTPDEKICDQLFSNPTLRLYTVVMFFNWVLVTLGKYYH